MIKVYPLLIVYESLSEFKLKHILLIVDIMKRKLTFTLFT